jgi:hypothetical protein
MRVKDIMTKMTKRVVTVTVRPDISVEEIATTF